MSIALAILSACAYGTGDFLAGLASRRLPTTIVATTVQGLSLAAAIVAVLFFSGGGPSAHTMIWGALAGLGAASGTLALYSGLSGGRMSVVATLSGLLTASLPAIVGIFQGDALTLVAAFGFCVAIAAIVLVSWHPGSDKGQVRTEAFLGLLGGLGFALLFIGLGLAGTESGAWPLIASQTVATLVLAPFALPIILAGRVELSRGSGLMIFASGLLGGIASLAFLGAAGGGQLAVVAVLTSLYPGITVFWAHLVLREHWNVAQRAGLVAAVVAVVLVSAGSA